MSSKYDWKEIEKDYNKGLTYDDISQRYGVSKSQISKQAKARGWESRKETLENVSVHLNDNVALELYKQIKYELGEQLTIVDDPLLSVLSNQYSRYVRLEKIVQDEGEVITSPKGGQYLSPNYTALLSSIKQLSTIAKDFGLTLKARKSSHIMTETARNKEFDYDELLRDVFK